MKRTLVIFLLISTYQASPTPNDGHPDTNYSQFECTEEASLKKGIGSNFMSNMYQKGMTLLFGKPRCECSCPNKTNAIAAREISSGNEKAFLCTICPKIGSTAKKCVIRTACTCTEISKGFGRVFADLFLGSIGIVVSTCVYRYHRVREKLGIKEKPREYKYPRHDGPIWEY